MFLSRDVIALQDRFPVNFDELYNDRSHIVLRVFESDGGQSQLRIDPLDAYVSDQMFFMLNNHSGFVSPGGLPELGPYLYVGVPGPPRTSHNVETESGLKANGTAYPWQCDNTQYYQFIQFPNRFDSSAEASGDENASLSGWLSSRENVTLENMINSPDDFQSVLELQFGSDTCGHHSIIQNWTSVTGTAIGLPFSKRIFDFAIIELCLIFL